MAERQQVTNYRVTGKIADWKGTFGWIDPSSPISHPDAVKRRGKVYLHVKDVEAEIEGIGSLVSFFVYTDGSGLGAMNVKPASATPVVVKTVTKPAATQATVKGAAKAGGKGAPGEKYRTVVSTALSYGQVSSVKGGFGWIAPSQPVQHALFKGSIYVQQTDMLNGAVLTEGQQVAFTLYSDGKGLGASQVRVVPSGPNAAKGQPTTVAPPKGAGKGAKPVSAAAAYGEKKEQAPPGPRERIGDVQQIGEIVEWKGSFGWAQLAEEVDHPDASKRRGRVYVAAKDCVGKKMFAPGDIVQFYLYPDGTGLGAEQCSSF
jgi:cold shock CspA family protein